MTRAEGSVGRGAQPAGVPAVDSVDAVDVWILPGELAGALAPEGGRTPRTARDWAVDSAVFAVCAFFWVAEALGWSGSVGAPGWLVALDLVGGAAMCVALWWRRSFPISVGVAAAVVGAFSNSAVGALLVAFFSLALHRGWRWGFGVVAIAQVLALPYMLTYFADLVGGPWVMIALVTAVLLLVTTAGLAVRARRQLVRVLAERANAARREQGRRVEAARAAERERIASEMHDVLAHRLSLLAVHAGALEYRISSAPDGVVPPEIARSIAVVRENAHLSLEELRDVLQVLRSDGSHAVGHDDADGTHPPAPTLASLPDLVAEAREAGQVVTLALAGTDLAPVPLAVQRTVYRVVQEGLTNARKHAPGAAVDVVVQVRLRAGEMAASASASASTIEVSVSNPVTPGLSAAELPGAGSGQLGLAERAAHHGGTVTHTVADGRYLLAARLPLRPDMPGLTS